MKKISVNKKVWREIHQIKRDKKLNSFSEVVEQLLNPKVVLKEETDLNSGDEQVLKSKLVSKGETIPDSQALDPEKFLQDMLSERTWNKIVQIKKDRGFDSFSRVIDHLLDAYNLMRQAKGQEKVEGVDALYEIHAHIEDLKTPGYFEKTDLMDIPKVYSEKAWLCCPICRSSFLLWSKSSEDKPEPGITFEFVDGHNQRHFRGVDNEYLPYQIRIGNEINVEKSMAISTLKGLDQRMHAHILQKLENAYFLFGGRRV